MDLMYQMMDQMQAAVSAAQVTPDRGAASRKQSADKRDFDTMIRQKQQDVRGQSDQRPAAAEDREVVQSREAEPGIPGEQYVLAAALMFQLQPNVSYVAVQTAETPVQSIGLTVPEELSQSAMPVAEEMTAATEAAQPVTEARAELPVEPVAFDRKPAFTEAFTVRTDTVAPEAGPEEPKIELSENEISDFDGERPKAMERNRTEDEIPMESVQPETPVFGPVAAAPVKVAEPVAKAPVALEAEDGMEQLGARIESLLTDESGNTRMELTLTPESLGKVTVEITHMSDGALHIQLSANTAKAVSLLERNTGGLHTILAADRRSEVQIEVRGGEETQQQFLNPDGEHGQNHHQQQNRQQPRQQHDRTQDFLQQLRLGLVGLDGATA